MKRLWILNILLFCVMNNVFGEEFEIAYNEGTNQPYKIFYRTLDDAPNSVEVSNPDFWNGELYEAAWNIVDVVEIPEIIVVDEKSYIVTTINTENGWGTDYSGPKKIVFPSSIRWIKSRIQSEIVEEIIFNDSPIEEISYEGYEYCPNLKYISFGNAYKAKSIGRFSDCPNLIEIEIPESVEEIPWGCFSSCISLKSTTIPASLKKIESAAFINCISLENILFSGNSENECEFIGENAFKNCESLKSISLPSVSQIRENAFQNCKSLSFITLSIKEDSDIRFGSHAFENCEMLKDIVIEASAIKDIGEAAFNNCSSLQNFSIPSDCENIGSRAFAGCTAIEKFNVLGEGGSYSDIDDVLIRDGQQIAAYPAGKKDATYSIPEVVSSIASGAFESAVNLTDINIHNNVTDLGVMAFRDCKALKQVSMPEGINHIPSGTFSGCSALESVNIPDNYIYIGTSSFQDCSALPEVKLPSELKVLGESAFINCSKIESIELPEQMTEIRSNTFRNCESLKTIKLSSKLDTIHSAALQGCKSLQSIELSESLRSLEERAFKGCESLGNLTIPDGVTQVGINAFEDCSSLKEVVVGNGVKEIGQWAFYNCTDMEKLVLGSSLESIGAEAFDGDINIRDITCLTTEPPTFPGGFPQEVVENATVTVPAGSEDAYNANDEWDEMVEGEVPRAETIELNLYEVELKLKESVTLVATVLPEDAIDKTVTWSSDDYFVAKVDENGNVTATGYGEAIIKATCGKAKAYCVVTIEEEEGVESLFEDADAVVKAYDIKGTLVADNLKKEDLQNLHPGLYIIRCGSKVQKLVIH